MPGMTQLVLSPYIDMIQHSAADPVDGQYSVVTKPGNHPEAVEILTI